MGSEDLALDQSIVSPYTSRILKPYIRYEERMRGHSWSGCACRRTREPGYVLVGALVLKPSYRQDDPLKDIQKHVNLMFLCDYHNLSFVLNIKVVYIYYSVEWSKAGTVSQYLAWTLGPL